jgi:hypothetical protein
MPTAKKKGNRKAAPAAKKAAPRRQQRGVKPLTIQQKNAKRFGDPNERLRTRLAFEAKKDLTPLDPNDQLLRLREAAAILSVSPHTVRMWALQDKIIYRRLGGLLLMIPTSEVERLKNTHGN